MMSSSFYAEMPHESKEKMNQPNTMKEMPEAERPYEKCEKMGAEKLTAGEKMQYLWPGASYTVRRIKGYLDFISSVWNG